MLVDNSAGTHARWTFGRLQRLDPFPARVQTRAFRQADADRELVAIVRILNRLAGFPLTLRVEQIPSTTAGCVWKIGDPEKRGGQ